MNDRVADVLAVGGIVVPDEPDGIVKRMQDVVTELGELRSSRDRRESELEELRREVASLCAVGDASQGQVDELRGVDLTLVPGAVVSNSVSRFRAGVGAVVAVSVAGAVERFTDEIMTAVTTGVTGSVGEV